DVETGGDFAAHEARLGEAQVELLALRARRGAQTQELTATPQVALGDRDVEQEAFGRRIAGGEGELARRLLFHRDSDDRAVGLRAIGVFDGDVVEVAQRTHLVARAIQKNPVERVALGNQHFAADNRINGAGVADDVDALDECTRALIDFEHDIDLAVLAIALDDRRDLDVGVTDGARDVGHRVDGVFNLLAAECWSGADRVDRAQKVFRQTVQFRLNLDFAELVANALFHRKGDVEIALVRRQFGDGRDDAEIRVAAVIVELAQLLAVVLETVRIVIVVAREEIPPARTRRHDRVAQAAIGEFLVADEIDVADAGDRTFIDFKDEIDAVLIEFAHLRCDLRGEAAVTAVNVEDALHVGLRACRREHRTRTGLDFAFEIFLVERAHAFEDHAVDDRVFADDNDEVGAALLDLDVREKARGE